MKKGLSLILLMWTILLVAACSSEKKPPNVQHVNYLLAITYDAEPTTSVFTQSFATGQTGTTLITVYYEVYDRESLRVIAVIYTYNEVQYAYSHEHLYLKLLFLTEQEFVDYLQSITTADVLKAMESVGLLKTQEDF